MESGKRALAGAEKSHSPIKGYDSALSGLLSEVTWKRRVLENNNGMGSQILAGRERIQR